MPLLVGHRRSADDKALTKADVDARLAKFDPRAVAAARHYYENPQLKIMVLTMATTMGKTMAGLVAQKNPSLTPQVQAKVQEVVNQAMAGQIDLIQQLGMLAALQTFTTDEIVAVDGFYSSARRPVDHPENAAACTTDFADDADGAACNARRYQGKAGHRQRRR